MNHEVVRAVLEAARTALPYMESRYGVLGENMEGADIVLMKAVRAFEEEISKSAPNRPHGFVLTRPWSLVPAGWFVRIPSGKSFEVMSTKFEDGKQIVELRDPESGKRGKFPRDPEAEVKCKRGTHTNQLSDAIEALSDVFPGTTVIDDSPPWDE